MPNFILNGMSRRTFTGFSKSFNKIYNAKQSKIKNDRFSNNLEIESKESMKYIKCIIHLLDDTEYILKIDKNFKGQVLQDKIFEYLELNETDYFGLQYLDNRSHKNQSFLNSNFLKNFKSFNLNNSNYINSNQPKVWKWLDTEKLIKNQLSANFENDLYFRVKFYVSDPAKLQEEFSRYNFFLQLKKDILEGKFVYPRKTAVLLCSYIVQSELGDFSQEENDIDYLKNFQFLPNQDDQILKEISDSHKLHRGQTPAEAEFNFLVLAKNSDTYGIEIHEAKNHENKNILIGIGNLGILIFKNKIKIKTINWSNIVKISFKKKQFFIQVKDDNNSKNLEIINIFYLQNHRQCKNLWKRCVENHTFFRLQNPKPQSKKFFYFFSLGSKFFYKGRTEFQTLEENKKRIKSIKLFERTPSKRYCRQTFPTLNSSIKQTSNFKSIESIEKTNLRNMFWKNSNKILTTLSSSKNFNSLHKNNENLYISNENLKKNNSKKIISSNKLTNNSDSNLNSLSESNLDFNLSSQSYQITKFSESKQLNLKEKPKSFIENLDKKINSSKSLIKNQQINSKLKTSNENLSTNKINKKIKEKNQRSSNKEISSVISVNSSSQSSHSNNTSVASNSSKTYIPLSRNSLNNSSNTDEIIDAISEASSKVIIKIKSDKDGIYGFNVKGGLDQNSPVIVTRIAPNTPADNCSPKLKEGDQIISINNQEVDCLTHAQVIKLIKTFQSQNGELKLKIIPKVCYQNLTNNSDLKEKNEPDFQYIPEDSPSTYKNKKNTDKFEESITLLSEGLESKCLVNQFLQVYTKKPHEEIYIAKLSANQEKNRYLDISPYDSTRVKIKNGTDEDYINASHVDIQIADTGVINKYIATQGPLPNTCDDFWQMVWEQKSDLIVMVTPLEESNVIKCYKYWPEFKETLKLKGDLKVTCDKKISNHIFTERKFTISHGLEKHKVNHILYLAWPDYGVPSEPDQFIKFIYTVRSYRDKTPIIVHCSAGIGRTGVLILIETAICLMEAKKPIYPIEILRLMRDQRAYLIQNSNQFEFVLRAILKIYKEKILNQKFENKKSLRIKSD